MQKYQAKLAAQNQQYNGSLSPTKNLKLSTTTVLTYTVEKEEEAMKAFLTQLSFFGPHPKQLGYHFLYRGGGQFPTTVRRNDQGNTLILQSFALST